MVDIRSRQLDQETQERRWQWVDNAHQIETITEKYRRARETIDECLPYPSQAQNLVNRTLSVLTGLLSQSESLE